MSRTPVQPARVLLVEDNEVNAYLASFLLQDAGIAVQWVQNGQQALDAVALQRPDLVLMDIRMPVMDGLEATRRLRADARLAGLQVVALSANAMPTEKTQAMQAGCDGHIEKPIDVARFIDQVRAHLARVGRGQA